MGMTTTEFQDLYQWHVLKPTGYVENFDCGDKDLNNFIMNEASDYSSNLLSVTYVVVSKVDNTNVVAFFSLSADKLSVNDFNSNSEFNRFRKKRFVHEKQLRSYPAIKLCRLGVDKSAKGTGIGSIVLSLIEYLCTNENRIGNRFITVDAYNEAVPFYQRNGFLPLTQKEINNYTKSLYFDLKDTIK